MQRLTSQPKITQSCIYRLCKHPEFQPPLLSEAEEYREVQFGSKNQEMPYLDSLLRETARLSPGPIGRFNDSSFSREKESPNLINASDNSQSLHLGR